MNILLACIGNIFQGDDGFGCEVARALADRPSVPDVRVVDFGIRGLAFAYALAGGPDLTILVDSVSRGGVPGTRYTIEPDLTNPDLTNLDLTNPDLTNLDLTNPDLTNLDNAIKVTPPVADAVARAATIVQDLIERERTSAAYRGVSPGGV